MKYDYQTVSRTMLGDLHTPVSTYLKVRDIFPQSALMESSDYHGSENNRSFIGLCPVASVSIDHAVAVFCLPDGTREEYPVTEEYHAENALRDFLNRFHVEGEYSDYCGLYGYTSFNAVRYFENIAVKDSREATNDAPDILYILYKYLIVFNDFKNEMLLLEMLAPDEKSELDKVQKAIHNRNYTAYDFRAVGETTSSLTDEEHKANIRRGIAHCMRGDVFQIVLSRRFEQRFVGDDFKLYRALRSINPSPYLFYFDFGGFRIFGSSPETHCRIEGRHAYIDPIAGTAKRTGNPEQDAVNARYLQNDPKENAEHVMLLLEMLAPDEKSELDKVQKAIHNRNYTAYDFRAVGETTSSLTDEEHKANIRRGIAHCMRGDVFQIVLSRRFEQRFVGDDFKLYRALRSINPSPYLFYFDFGGFRIFGSSPETHCRIEGRHAYIDPIAGTAKRTGNPEQDAVNARYLQNDPKENAEHVMLVDLARNDLSRNCHDVKVDFYKEMQYYSHVIHLVSRVSGTLNSDTDSIRTFIDTFPAGTLSGAPKVRAMQLISELEPHNRGAYGGCIGFIGLNGSLNQAITIRTFVSRNGMLWFQAGGGIVAKSNAEYELQEVNNKLGALKKAIAMAENSL